MWYLIYGFGFVCFTGSKRISLADAKISLICAHTWGLKIWIHLSIGYYDLARLEICIDCIDCTNRKDCKDCKNCTDWLYKLYSLYRLYRMYKLNSEEAVETEETEETGETVLTEDLKKKSLLTDLGIHRPPKVQFFLTLFKKPLTPPPFCLNIMWWIFLKEF